MKRNRERNEEQREKYEANELPACGAAATAHSNGIPQNAKERNS